MRTHPVDGPSLPEGYRYFVGKAAYKTHIVGSEPKALCGARLRGMEDWLLHKGVLDGKTVAEGRYERDEYLCQKCLQELASRNVSAAARGSDKGSGAEWKWTIGNYEASIAAEHVTIGYVRQSKREWSDEDQEFPPEDFVALSRFANHVVGDAGLALRLAGDKRATERAFAEFVEAEGIDFDCEVWRTCGVCDKEFRYETRHPTPGKEIDSGQFLCRACFRAFHSR